MKITYSEKLRQAGEWHVLAQQVTKRLEEELRNASTAGVTGEWDQAADEQGRACIALRLIDWSGEATAVFTPEDFSNPHYVDIRLYRLWGDVLQARSHLQLRELLETGSKDSE